MRRATGIIIGALIIIVLTAYLAIDSDRASARIAELEHDNEVLSRLCGVLACIPCNKGETGPQCQARMGDAYEVIYYPDAGAYIAELRGNPEP